MTLKLVGSHESDIWRIIMLNAYIWKEFQPEISIQTKKLRKEQHNKPKETWERGKGCTKVINKKKSKRNDSKRLLSTYFMPSTILAWISSSKPPKKHTRCILFLSPILQMGTLGRRAGKANITIERIGNAKSQFFEKTKDRFSPSKAEMRKGNNKQREDTNKQN